MADTFFPFKGKVGNYFTLNFSAAQFVKLPFGFSLGCKLYLKYLGSLYGDIPPPFYKLYTLGGGGVQNLRGFESGSVGPKEKNQTTGGNYLANMTFKLRLPEPLSAPKYSLFLFADIGYVDHNYKEDFKDYIGVNDKKIKYSLGFGGEGLVPLIGTLRFSVAYGFNLSKKDRLNKLDFGKYTGL
jgi:outer membrane protein assembly factor BamA